MTLIEAVILGKVIVLGSVFHLGRSLEQKLLIYPTLYKAVVFTFLVAIFTLIENTIKALWTGKGLAASSKCGRIFCRPSTWQSGECA